MIAFPRRQLTSLQDLAARVLESRGVNADHETLSREMLVGFYDVCTRAGLDGVIAALAQAFDELDVTDGATLAADPRLHAALATRLGDKAAFDARGPRTAKPKQLADCLLAVLTLEPSDPADRDLSLSDELRREVSAALASVIDAQLAVPQVREAIIAAGRARCEERHLKSYDKLVEQLDERGQRIMKQLKLPLDAVQATNRVLTEARALVVARAAKSAIDRAKATLERTSPEAAARLDQPITHQLTPRDVAIARVTDVHASKAPDAVVRILLDSLSELANLAWQVQEQIARPYGASQTYAVGELVEHPKFGRGTVKSVEIKRIEVAFPEAVHTLVHARK